MFSDSILILFLLVHRTSTCVYVLCAEIEGYAESQPFPPPFSGFNLRQKKKSALKILQAFLGSYSYKSLNMYCALTRSLNSTEYKCASKIYSKDNYSIFRTLDNFIRKNLS